MSARSGLFVAPTSGVGTAPIDGRLALSGVLGATAQTVHGGAITQSGSTMAFTVAQAVLQLPDPTNAAAAFLSAIDQTVLTPAAGPSTGSRVDLIVAKQNNPENGDADSRASFSLIAGIAGAPGVPPAVPVGYFHYADINVPTNAANAAACTITLRSPTSFAPVALQCPTKALLDTVTGTLGQTAVVTSDATTAYNRMWFWSSTGWVHSLNTSTPFAEAFGTGTYPSIGAGASANVAVSFPAGRFTVPPIVFVTPDSSRLTGSYNSITTSGANANLGNWSPGAAGGGAFSWHAVQMKSASAAG